MFSVSSASLRLIPLILLLAVPLLAAEPRVAKDRPYAEPANAKQTLDV